MKWLALLLLVSVPLAAQDRASTPDIGCAAGLYLIRDAADPKRDLKLSPTLTGKPKMAGLGMFMLTGGITGAKLKTVIPGAASNIRTQDPRPNFRFCAGSAPLAAKSSVGGSDYVGANGAASSPSAFRLVAFDGKSTKDRELVSAKIGMGSVRGALSDAMQDFSVTEIAPGVFQMVPARPLPPGEYGFTKMPADVALDRKRPPAEIFDFGVDAVPAAGQ
jgi:hypothetical protein